MRNFLKKRYGLWAAAMLACGLLVSAGKSDFDVAKSMEVLFNLIREVSLNYVDETDPDELMKKGADGMLEKLDPYTTFLSEKEMEGFEVMTTGKYGGIGALIRKKGEWVEIAQPYRGFAADKAGLRIGDKIRRVDDFDARDASTEEVSNRMKGDPGTTFKMEVERFADGSIEELTIQRERIVLSGITYSGMLNDSVGYVAHSDFTEGCSDDLRDAIMELKKQGMKALVYDLRDNGGGILQEAVKIVGMFVPRASSVVETRGRGEQGVVYKTPSAPIDPEMPLLVLVNRNSASASEIVAGALQDYDRAVIVGQRSFGKGLVQSTRPVGYNNYVKMTTAKYYIPSGRCIQAIDYSHRDAEGRVTHVPDSLIREFRTAGGRRVYDGGGIMPDVVTPEVEYDIFTAALYGYNYLEDYAMEYIRRTAFQPVDADHFRLSDGDYADFIAFMADKPVDYESQTKAALEVLKKTAEQEHFADRIAPELEALTEKIAKNKTEELERLKPEISRLIESNIVLYYDYAQGVVRHRLSDDTTFDAALSLLADPAEVQRILSSQDTQKN
jgi:carboxyl-terminal processing protease